jgi:hypothetical protein
MKKIKIDFKDDFAVECFLYGEDEALDNITIGMVKQDNIECCICLNYNWGVKLPNCNHFICPKCYHKIYYGYISNEFRSKVFEPKYPEKPIYPYQNKNQNTYDKNRELFYTITKDETYKEWFICENEDLYNSVKLNSEFVDKLDINLKTWFENNELIKQYDIDLKQYDDDLKQYDVDTIKYDELYEEEKENNTHQICPLCRL